MSIQAIDQPSYKSPRIAVLMAAYNGELWIAEQIMSILQQQYVKVDLYISVDLSSDRTFDISKQIAANDKAVHILPYGQRFGGAGPNFYRLIKDVPLEHYDAIALADQDDIWLPTKLHRAFSLIQTKGYDAVSSDVIAFWPDGREKKIKKSYHQRSLDYLFEAAGPGCTYVIAKPLALKLQRFLLEQPTAVSQVALHDWLIYAYSRQHGAKWYIDDQPLLRYRQHTHNQVGAHIGLKATLHRLKLIKNKWYRHQVVSIAEAIASEHSGQLQKKYFLVRHVLSFRRRRKDRLALLFMFLSGLF